MCSITGRPTDAPSSIISMAANWASSLGSNLLTPPSMRIPELFWETVEPLRPRLTRCIENRIEQAQQIFVDCGLIDRVQRARVDDIVLNHSRVTGFSYASE